MCAARNCIISQIMFPFQIYFDSIFLRSRALPANRIWHTKTDNCLYMLFEYVVGGELFTYLRNAGRFNNATGK